MIWKWLKMTENNEKRLIWPGPRSLERSLPWLLYLLSRTEQQQFLASDHEWCLRFLNKCIAETLSHYHYHAHIRYDIYPHHGWRGKEDQSCLDYWHHWTRWFIPCWTITIQGIWGAKCFKCEDSACFAFQCCQPKHSRSENDAAADRCVVRSLFPAFVLKLQFCNIANCTHLLIIYCCPSSQVHGIVRRSSCFNTGRIDHVYKDRHETGVKLFLHYGDLCDATNLISIIAKVKPDEIYNLGAMSHVKVSFDMPEYTADCDGVGVLRMLDAIRASGLEKKVRFYQASTSELYGKVREVPQSELTPFYPRSPYAGTFPVASTLILVFLMMQ